MSANILVIDDEESLRFTFETFLTEDSYEVTTAENYDQALASLEKGKFDLVVCDILMGGKTGIDLLREITKRKLPCMVVMVTGFPNVETAAEAVRLGAFDYLPKPVTQEALLRVAKMALRHLRLQEEKKSYQANLEAIFRSVRDAIITVDQNLTILAGNTAAAENFGIVPSMIGKKFAALCRGCSGKCLEALRTTLEKKSAVELDRLECCHPNYPQQVVTINTSPLLDNHGEFTGAVLVIRDETRLHVLERDLRERTQFHHIIGSSHRMQEIYGLLEKLADATTTTLIIGESGTGKELIVDALHSQGKRRHGPLIKVNCAGLSENLLESELFGHVKGAFTGAIKDKAGRFLMAKGGTIFLDEIGDISPKMQTRLLRVLQEKVIERVGDTRPIKVDIRVVAATNQDLVNKIKNGEFREDLFYRLKVVTVKLPPLRDRRPDIPLLVKHFIDRFNRKLNRQIRGISAEVRSFFMTYHWPGNVRELEHILEHAFILCPHTTIAMEHLPPDLQGNVIVEVSPPSFATGNNVQAIRQALETTDWNKAKAARLLGMSRRTIYRKIDEYQIVKD